MLLRIFTRIFCPNLASANHYLYSPPSSGQMTPKSPSHSSPSLFLSLSTPEQRCCCGSTRIHRIGSFGAPCFAHHFKYSNSHPSSSKVGVTIMHYLVTFSAPRQNLARQVSLRPFQLLHQQLQCQQNLACPEGRKE